MRAYKIKTTQKTITTTASNKKQAVKQVMAMLNCPARAIITVNNLIFMKPYSLKYGAPMGERSEKLGEIAHIQQIYIDRWGYAENGVYWGVGKPVYCAVDTDGNRSFCRADNHKQAKEYFNENV